MEEFEKKVQGIIDSFKWAIDVKRRKNEDIEIELQCLEDAEIVMRYIKRFKRGLL